MPLSNINYWSIKSYILSNREPCILLLLAVTTTVHIGSKYTQEYYLLMVCSLFRPER